MMGFFHFRKSVLLVVLPMIMSSCFVNYYKAEKKYVPELRSKGDLKGGVVLNTKNIISSMYNGRLSSLKLDGFIAYSPKEQLGLMLSTNSNPLDISIPVLGEYSSDYGLSRFTELHVGYYKIIQNNKLIELYGFGGIGRIKPFEFQEAFHLKQRKIGFNTGIWLNGDGFRIGVHSGLVRHAFSNTLYEGKNALVSNVLEETDKYLANNYVENAFTIKYLHKNTELEFQLVRINHIGSRENIYNYLPYNISLGLIYNIGSHFKKQPTHQPIQY